MAAESFYISADGDEIYVPRTVPFNRARSIAADHAEELGDEWNRTRYTGKRNVPLHDHKDWEECEECPAVPVWCFEVYEGTFRR